MKRICIDPGHGLSNRTQGRYDPGCIVEVPGTLEEPTTVRYEEASIVLKYAWELSDWIDGYPNTDTTLTRRGDREHCPLVARADIARAFKSDIFVSLHLNAHTNKNANGLEIYYNKVARKLAQHVQSDLIPDSGFKDRGIKLNPGFKVLDYEKMAILIEIGFLSNSEDRSKIIDNSFRDRFCEELANSLLNYVD